MLHTLFEVINLFMNKIKEIFRALKYRNFRLFFPGLAISQIGFWVQNVAIAWVIYDLTKSPFIMGTVMFFNSIPLFLLTPFAGVIVDKFDRQKLLFTVQILFALQTLIMTVLSFIGLLRIWNIIVLGVFLSSIAAIDAPLRQSTFVLVVDDKKEMIGGKKKPKSSTRTALQKNERIAAMEGSLSRVTRSRILVLLCRHPKELLPSHDAPS